VDGLLKSFRLGASEAGVSRIVSIYSRVLHAGRYPRVRPIVTADRLAFRRLLWEAPESKSDNVLREIQGVIHDDPGELIDLARSEVDHLIGAAILMDERIAAFEAEAPTEQPTMLEVMKRSNHRQTLYNLRRCFTSWAAAGAAAAEAPQAYLDILDRLPEKQDSFAACMIERSMRLADTAEGLNAVLPSLYSAMVGASVLRRAAAAYAFGEMPLRQRRNVPDLLFEAFLAALTDPYVYVHRSAVMAMRRFHLPEQFRNRVRHGLWRVLLAHHRNEDNQDLVLEIIEEIDGLLADGEKAGRPGAFLVSLLAKMPAWRLSNEIRGISRELARAEGMVELLITLLTDSEATEYSEEYVLGAIAALPTEIVYAHRAKIAAVPNGQEWPGRFRVLHLLEVLSRCQAWSEGEEMMATAVAAIPETVREASVRLTLQLAHSAVAFENALARGNSERAAAMAARWREVKIAKEVHDRAIGQRPDPLKDLRRSPGSG
jgi:hypothetical protein